MADPTQEDFEKLAERLMKAGKGTIYRVGEDLAKLLEEHQPKAPTFKSPILGKASTRRCWNPKEECVRSVERCPRAASPWTTTTPLGRFEVFYARRAMWHSVS